MLRQRVASTLAGRLRASSGNPPPDPRDGGLVETSSDEDGETTSAAREGKPWMRVDKIVYEEQLEKLQEQLVQVMLENQALQAELDEHKKKPSSAHKRELDQLKQENISLQRRLQSMSASASTSTHASVSSEDSSVEGGFETVTVNRDRVLKLRQRRLSVKRRRFSYASVRESVYNFLSLFSEDARTASDEQEEEATPLTAKRLKENVSRLVKSSKPWREMLACVRDTLCWKSTAESLVVFLIYMYCVWNGWIIQLLLLISVVKLTLNYLYISGLAEQFGFGSGVVEEEVDEAMGLADKFHLVKQVAQTVQNASGSVSDSLEKLRNLVLWRHPEATRQLYVALCAFLIITLFLPNTYTLTLIGLGIGMKLFIVNNIYHKYPKVQEEYDSVERMWKALPTDVELLERQSLTQEEAASLQRLRHSSSGDRGGDAGREALQMSEEDAGFCARFDLPAGEVPFPDWQGGRRCSLMDRERPLMGSKGGRLFLTYSFLCFERSSKARDPDRMVLPLADITDIGKAKPFAVLPGNGMALELTRKTSEKPLMFGAILNRDQTLDSILEQGTILGLPWGADLDDLCTPDHTHSSLSNNQSPDNTLGHS